jgi:hypothetical protein
MTAYSQVVGELISSLEASVESQSIRGTNQVMRLIGQIALLKQAIGAVDSSSGGSSGGGITATQVRQAIEAATNLDGVEGALTSLDDGVAALLLSLGTPAEGAHIKPANGAIFPIGATTLPLPTGAATEVTLNAILAELRDDVFVDKTLWEDRSTVNAVFYREERIRSQDDGSISTIYTRLSDGVAVVSLPPGVTPVQGAGDREIEYYRWKASANGTGYSSGDWISNTLIFDTDGSGAVVVSSWYNLSTSAAIAAPPGGDLADPNDQLRSLLATASNGGYIKPATGATFPVSATTLPLPNGAATETTLSAANAAIGTAVDAAWVSGAGTLIALLKAIATATRSATGSSPVNGFVATGGTAQELAAADANAVFAEFQNQSSGDLWIKEGGAAGVDSGFKVVAGGGWHSEPKHKPTGAFSVYGANTGQKFVFQRG